MLLRLTIFVLAAFALAEGQTVVQTNSQPPGPQFATVSETHNISFNVLGKHYEISIDDRLVSTSPSWSRPSSKQPPLSVERAIRISEKAVPKYVDDPKKWRLDTVALRSIGTQSKWYYLIRWYPQWSGYIGDGIDIAVLMNGVPVEPKVEPESTP
jgi:hypothetical protein